MWPFRSLSECCNLITDGTHYTPPPVDDGVPFLTVKDMTDNGLDLVGSSRMTREEFERAASGNSAPQKGDVLFSKDGTVGKVHVVGDEGEFAVLSSIAILRPDPSAIDAAFLGYILRHQSVLLDALNKKTGSAIRRLVLRDLKSVKIPVPPLPEQRRIADLLARAEGIVRLRREASMKAAELIPALFLDMFGDPVTNPKGWPLIRLGESESRVQIGPFGSLLHKEDYISGGVPLINPMHIIKGRIEPGTEQTVREEKAAELSAYRLAAGDVVMGRRGEMGRCAIVSPLEAGMLCGTGSLFIRPAPTEFSPVFLSAVLSSAQMKQHLESVSQGVTLANLNRSMIEALQIPIPPMALQKSFAQRVQDAESIQAQQSAATAKAQETFDALLASVFSDTAH